MNQQIVPTYFDALTLLNECHKNALTFQINYLDQPSEAEVILQQLHSTLTSFYNHLPHPESISISPSYDYATFYHCIHHLYHNPLTRIDIGNQMAVTQSYIDIIMQTKTHLHA